MTPLIQQVRSKLETELAKHQINAEITGRVKSIFSIWRAKCAGQKIAADQVYDIVAFRIIAETVKDCYGALGIVHSIWLPVPGRIKDFIAMPAQLYQSLHTTVMSGAATPFEVQRSALRKCIRSPNRDRRPLALLGEGMLTDREVGLASSGCAR